MSLYESRSQDSIDCTADEQPASREELQLRFELAKLDIVELRQRVAELEGQSSCDLEDHDIPTVSEVRERLRSELQSLEAEQ